jgi:phosphoribosylformylglycinamidine synthase
LTDKSAGHDIGSGGLITTLLEMCFADLDLGATINFDGFGEKDPVKILFSENIGIVFQAKNDAIRRRKLQGIEYFKIGKVTNRATLDFHLSAFDFQLDINEYRDTWFETSPARPQTIQNGMAEERFKNYKNQPLQYTFPSHFTEKPTIDEAKPRPKAAIIREKGSNSEREMANAMYLAGFDVKDVHMTDLISGRQTTGRHPIYWCRGRIL